MIRAAVVALGLIVILLLSCLMWSWQMGRQATALLEKPDIVLAFERLYDKTSHDGTTGLPTAEDDHDGSAVPHELDKWVSNVRACQKLFGSLDTIPQDVDLDSAGPDELTAIVASNQDLLAEIRSTATRGGPVQGVKLTGSPARDGQEMVDAYIALGHCRKLLEADAMACVRGGDYEGCVDDLIAGIRLGRALAMEPYLDAQLSATVTGRAILMAAQKCVDIDGRLFARPFRQRLAEELSEGDVRSGLRDAFDGRCWRLHLFCARLADGCESFPQPTVQPIGRRLVGGSYDHFFGRPWLYRDEVAMLSTLRRQQELANKPFHEAMAELAILDAEIERRWWYPMARDTTGSVDFLFEMMARYEARAVTVRLAALIEDFFDENGCYPASLQELKCDSLPVDPFTGKGCLYIPSERGFVVYSTGPDLKDDRAGVWEFRRSDGTAATRELDIVWHGRRPPDN